MRTNTLTQELLDCLEIALSNSYHDTLPRPGEIKRMRDALAAAKEFLPKSMEQLLAALGEQIENLRPHNTPKKETIAAANATAKQVNRHVRSLEDGTSKNTQELFDCLELALAHFQHDTVPRPTQLQRMRQAIAEAEASLCRPNNINSRG